MRRSRLPICRPSVPGQNWSSRPQAKLGERPHLGSAMSQYHLVGSVRERGGESLSSRRQRLQHQDYLCQFGMLQLIGTNCPADSPSCGDFRRGQALRSSPSAHPRTARLCTCRQKCKLRLTTGLKAASASDSGSVRSSLPARWRLHANTRAELARSECCAQKSTSASAGVHCVLTFTVHMRTQTGTSRFRHCSNTFSSGATISHRPSVPSMKLCWCAAASRQER